MPFLTQQFVRFLAVGAFAALVNLLARYLLNRFVNYSIAIILAYLCGMATAFVLSKYFVFETSRLNTSTEFIRFGLVNLVALFQVWGVSVGLAELFPHLGVTTYADDLAHAIGVATPIFTSFVGHKYFSFSRG